MRRSGLFWKTLKEQEDNDDDVPNSSIYFKTKTSVV